MDWPGKEAAAARQLDGVPRAGVGCCCARRPRRHIGESDHGQADHLCGFAHHRGAGHVRRPHRPALPRPGAPCRARRQARRPLRHRRHGQAHPDGAHRRRGQARRGAPDVRRPDGGHAPGRLRSRGAARRAGRGRGQRGGPLSDRRDDALQSPGLRLQARVLRRLQRLDRGVLRGAPRPAHRRRANRDAVGGGGHRGPARDEAARAPRRDDAGQSGRRGLRRSRSTRRSTRRPSTSACRCPSTS